jgi:RNase P protein component
MRGLIGLFKVQSKKYKEQSRNRLRRWLREMIEMIFVTKSAGRLSCEATTSD